MGDVGAWLEGIGLGRYASLFARHEIELEDLASLSEEDLAEIGVPLGPRRRILRAVGAGAPAGADRPAAAQGWVAGERRHLTVMFIDLVGSTALAERLDPEDMALHLRGFQEACESAVARYEGHIANYLGDGVLVYFGFPEAHEDDAERAILSALRLRESLKSFEGPERPQARVGIASGVVVSGQLRREGAMGEGGATGETPNLAARLQGLAGPNDIVVAPSTRRLAGRAFEYADCGQFSLKGFSKPVRAWKVLGARESASRFSARWSGPLAPMIGRGLEMDRARRRWALAREGRGQALLLSGEAGIGKSRLTEALRRELRAERPLELRLQCSPHGVISALHPVIALLRAATRPRRSSGSSRRLDRLAALMGEPDDAALRLLADLLSIPCDDRLPALSLSPEERRARTLDLLVEQLAALARRRRALVLFEDAHWIDPTTRELLDRVVAALAELPALLVVTARPDFAPDWADAAHVARIELQRLSDAETAKIVDVAAAARPLPEALRRKIAAHAAGVPLFAEEITRDLVEAHGRDGAAPESLAVPSSLQAALMARLDRVGPAKDVAQAGAVVGRRFSRRLVEALMPNAVAAVGPALERLAAVGIVEPDDAEGETFLFRHALIHDVAYGSLLRRDRQAMHGRVADSLVSLSARIAEVEPERLARHYALAARPAEAVPLWRAAAQRAAERSANVEAVAHLAAALESIAALPAGAGRDLWELEIQTLRAGAFRSTLGIAADETGRAYARALELGGDAADPASLFPALNGLYAFHLVRAEYAEALAIADRILASAERDADPEHRMVGRRARGAVLLHMGRPAEARENLREALTLYDAERHARLAYVYGTDHAAITASFLSLSEWLLGEGDAALARQLAAVAAAERLDHAHSVAQALTYLCLLRLMREEFDAAAAAADRLAALSEEYSFPFMRTTAAFWRSWADAERDPRPARVEAMHAAARAWWMSGAGNYQPLFLTAVARLWGRAGRPETGRAMLETIRRRERETGEAWAAAETLRAEAELRADDPARAERLLRQAAAVAEAGGAVAFARRAARSLAALQAGDGPAAPFAADA